MNKQQTENILKSLKSRTQPDPDKQLASKQAVMQHWHNKLSQKRRQRIRWGTAIAASMVLAVAMWLLSPLNQQRSVTGLYQNYELHGTIQLTQEDTTTKHLSRQTPVSKGDVIQSSADSYVIWLLNDGSELTQGPNTKIVWKNDQHIKLFSGQLYHNTDFSQQANDFLISTDTGEVQHIGTQYVVEQQAQTLKVAVKSGAVKVQTSNHQHIINPSELIAITDDEIATIEHFDAYHNPLWSWTFQAQKPYELNGRSLYDFVMWMSQQTGLSIDWQGQEQATQQVSLQGSIQNMTAQTALKTVFASTDYTYQINQGHLQIIHKDK